MKEIPSVASPVKQKLGKKKRKRKIIDESEKQNENLQCIDENIEKKKVKKIKIRLADPNIPDSYICEVFDSSLEREEAEEEEKYQRKTIDQFSRGRDTSKQRNYFDVLMSRDVRRNSTINSATLNEKIPEETKLLREVENEEVVQKRKSIKAKNKGKLMELVKKRRKQDNSYCSSSSDDESLFQVRSSLRLFSENKKVESSNAKEKDKESATVPCDSTTKSNTPTSKPKTSNILNYFSKTTVKPAAKVDGQLKATKLTEINMFEKAEKESLGTDPRKPENVKLAPLFQKRLKPVVDPNVQKARMEFLRRGLPTQIKKIREGWKIPEEKLAEFHFPLVSHVQQRDDDPLWHTGDVTLPLVHDEKDFTYDTTGKIFRFEIRERGISSNSTASKSHSNLNSLKLRYKNLNVESIFIGFKEKRDNFMKNVENCYNSDDSVEMIDIDVGDGCYSLWTNLYKPKSDEIMGNKRAVEKLSGWLKSWKEYSNEVMKSSNRVKKKAAASFDDSNAFASSEDESSILRPPVNICMLSGPIASGKTALVYALAKELDFNVLEVNASSRRTGKKLLISLEEATQSHQVSSGFAVQEDRKEEAITRNFNTKENRKSSGSYNRNSQMSLILIEDADIFFEDHDEGFASAITTLVQSSKRPLIFLSNDPNCGYLERLKQQQIVLLEMRRPNFQHARAVLDVMASVEGVSIDRKALDNLILGNDCDLRKSILELQFWGDLIGDYSMGSRELGKVWWGLNRFMYGNKMMHDVGIELGKRKKSNDFYDSSDDDDGGDEATILKFGATKSTNPERKSDSSIHKYSRILDCLSIGDLLKIGFDCEPIPSIESRPYDGLSLNERMESVDWKAKDLSGSIVEEIVEISTRLFAGGSDRVCLPSNPSPSEIRWRNIHRDAKTDLVSLLPRNVLNSKRNTNVDYLPIMRNICRMEKNRYMGNTKRKNRFSHYFTTLGHNPRDESLEISCGILN